MITRKTQTLNDIDFLAGEAILIDKRAGFTSFNVVSKIRRATGVKKVGHAGTLDPFATGLLILCTGKKTKEIYKYQDLHKTYSGVISIGKRTPSMDTETDFFDEKSFDGITDDQIELVRKSFLGEIEQVVPMFSAVKHKGKALYKYARKGQEIKRDPRKTTIYNFEIEKIELPDIYFRISCSKGTYIRVIADDFGQKLGCGAYLKELRREAIGEYNVENAVNVDQFEELFKSD